VYLLAKGGRFLGHFKQRPRRNTCAVKLKEEHQEGRNTRGTKITPRPPEHHAILLNLQSSCGTLEAGRSISYAQIPDISKNPTVYLPERASST
jgi:hypothetical protein